MSVDGEWKCDVARCDKCGRPCSDPDHHLGLCPSPTALAAPVEPAPDDYARGLAAGRAEGVAAVLAERALWQKPTEKIRAEGAAWMREQAARAVTPRPDATSDDAREPADFYPHLGESSWGLLERAQARIRSLPVSPPAPASEARCPRPHHLLLAGEKCPTCGEVSNGR